jgi:hypothetical protein
MKVPFEGLWSHLCVEYDPYSTQGTGFRRALMLSGLHKFPVNQLPDAKYI